MSSTSTRPGLAEHRGPRRFRTWGPRLVLVICGLATLAGTAYVSQTTRTRDQIRFQSAAQDIQSALYARLETYVAMLRAGSALFAGSDRVRRVEFERFVAHLELRERFPGVQGIGFAMRVPASEVARLEGVMQAEHGEEFAVWPMEPSRDVYYPIVYLEPKDRRNRAALGYDMFSEEIRHQAMSRAAETGVAVASGMVTLVQEIDQYKQSGFLIYQPVYSGGIAPADPALRLKLLEGFIYSPFRAEDLLNTVLSGTDRLLLTLQVFDGPTVTPGALLFDSNRQGPPFDANPALRVVKPIEVAGRPWAVVVSGRPEFSSSSPLLVPQIFLAGVFLTLILFQLTRLEARARAEAEEIAADLQRSEEALQAASRAKDEFLATLSHELRTPLNAILGWVRMVRMGHLDESRRERALEVIERNARVQAQLIEDLLDVSRIITGKLRLDLRSISVNPLLEEALQTVRPAADAKGITITWTPDPAAGFIHAAPERIQQIAWNLLSNAIKFTPAGGSVHVSTANDGDSVVVVVRDTGVGITAAFLPHVFERFRQADSTTTRSHAGVGLGLAIVRHLVELHGGTITAASEGENRGATFTVVFPTRREGVRGGSLAAVNAAAAGASRARE